jgi:hypothetical protein
MIRFLERLLCLCLIVLPMAAMPQTIDLRTQFSWRDTTTIGKDMTYAQAKAKWPAWVGYMEYIGASSKVLNIRKAAAWHNEAVWANDDGPGVTNYANGCGSRANIIWPHGTFRVDIDLIRPQGQVWGEGTQGYVLDSWGVKPGGTTLVYDHAGWDGDPAQRFMFRDMTWGRVDNFGYTESSQLHGFKIMGQGTGLYDPSYHFSAIGAWKAGEDYLIEDVFIYEANNYGIELGGQFHATFYTERVSIFKCGVGAYGVIGGAHMQVHMGSYDDNPSVFHVRPDAQGSIGNGTSLKVYGIKFETGKTAARPYSRGQQLLDAEDCWVKMDVYGFAYSKVNSMPHSLIRYKGKAGLRSSVNIYGVTWFDRPAYMLHDRDKGRLYEMDATNGFGSNVTTWCWNSVDGVILSPGVTLKDVAASCDQRLAPLARDPMTGNAVGSWSGCTPLYSYTQPIASEGGTVTPPPTPTPCTYTTGPWGACVNGVQVRTVTSSPAGCTGTSPPTTQPCTIVVEPPPTTPGAINPADVLVVINSADPASAAMAQAYSAAWKTTATVTVNLGSSDELTNATVLNTARTAINNAGKQFTVLAFSKPSRYGSQSITSAVTFGPRSVSSLTASVLYNYTGTTPRTAKGVAPSFLLVDAKYIKASVTKNGATGNSYMILAKDQTPAYRGNARASQTAEGLTVWDYRNVTGMGEGVNTCNQLSMNCWISGRIPSLPILAYYGSMFSLGTAAGVTWQPGFYGDHVTSYGGFLPGNSTYTNSKGQTALTWHLDRGASMSVGSVSEPGSSSLPAQFVNVSIFHPLFLAGTPVGIAAWSAVQAPDRMLFAGDPLYQTK